MSSTRPVTAWIHAPEPLPDDWTDAKLDQHGAVLVRHEARAHGLQVVGETKRQDVSEPLVLDTHDGPRLVRMYIWEAQAEPVTDLNLTVAVRAEPRDDGTWSATIPEGFPIAAITHGLDVPPDELEVHATDRTGAALGLVTVLPIQTVETDDGPRHEIEVVLADGTRQLVLARAS